MVYGKLHNKFSALLNLGLTALNKIKNQPLKVEIPLLNRQKKGSNNCCLFSLTIPVLFLFQ